MFSYQISFFFLCDLFYLFQHHINLNPPCSADPNRNQVKTVGDDQNNIYQLYQLINQKMLGKSPKYLYIRSKSLQLSIIFIQRQKQGMIAVLFGLKQQNQEFQASYYSQLQGSLESVSSGNFQDLNIEDLSSKSTLERYLCNDYQILKRDELALSQFWKMTNQNDLEQKINRIRSYLKGQIIKEESESDKRQKRNQISSEFTLSLKSIPSYSIIYFHIYEISGNRFNMLIHNSKGECLGYFWKQLKCKKIPKLRKVINSIAKPLMIFVHDQSNQTIESLVEIAQKIKDQANQFAYISKCKHHVHVLQSINEINSEDQTGNSKDYRMKQFQEGIMILSLNISQINEIDVLSQLNISADRFSHQESQFLTAVRGNLLEKDRNLQFDFVLINIFRAWNCLPSQIIVIIQRLQMEQKQSILNKNYKQKQKQIQREHNKDPNNHFPQRIKTSKVCKKCEFSYKKKIRKTKFRCEGCSITFQRDITLCPLCFEEFHEKIQFFAKRLGKSRLTTRKIRIHKKKEKNNDFEIIDQERSQKKQAINLEHQANLEQIEKSMNEQPIQDPVLIEKTKQINKLMNQTFEIVQKLKQNQQFDILKLFLGSLLNCSLNRMKNLSSRYKQLSKGITKIGNQVFLQVETSKMVKLQTFQKQEPLEKSSQSQLSSEENEK